MLKRFFTNFTIGERLVFLLFLTLPFERVLTWEFYGFTIKPPYLAGILLVGYFLFNLFQGKIKLEFKKTEWLLVSFFTFSFATIFWSIDVQKTLIIGLMFIFVLLISLSVASFIRKENIIRFAKIFIILGTVSVFFGLWQFFGDMAGLPQRLTLLGEDYVKGVFPFPRIQSTYFEPLFFANFLLIPLFLSLYLKATNRSTRFFDFSLFVLGLGFFLTLSRGGILAFSLTLFPLAVVWFFYFRKTFKQVINYLGILTISLFAALGFIFCFTGMTGVKSYFGQVSNNQDLVEYNEHFRSQVTRSYTIKVALDTWKDQPFGIGNGTFGSLPEFDWVVTEQGNTRQTVNSLYPEILVELGIIGFLLFVLFLLSLGVDIIKQVLRKKIFQLTLLGALFAIFFQYLAFSTLYLIYLWVFIGFVLKSKSLDYE